MGNTWGIINLFSVCRWKIAHGRRCLVTLLAPRELSGPENAGPAQLGLDVPSQR